MEGLRRALAPIVETGMVRHLADMTDNTPIRIACDVPNGYAVTISLAEMRELQRIYNALLVLDGLREID